MGEPKTDNVLVKIAKARVMLQNRNLKKSGKNKFAGYSYYELGDFLPSVNAINEELGLLSVVEISDKNSTLTVFNIESEGGPDEITFITPTAEATLKGAHPVQNLGAQITYLRRYLYMLAYEIVESDAVDASGPKDKAKSPPRKEEPNKERLVPPEQGQFKEPPMSDKQKGYMWSLAKELYKGQAKYELDQAAKSCNWDLKDLSTGQAKNIIDMLLEIKGKR
jgi:hypothetical protein